MDKPTKTGQNHSQPGQPFPWPPPAFFALILIVVLPLMGCRRNRDGNAGAPNPVLRISQRNEPSVLDPATASLPDEFFIIRALSEGLVVPAPNGLRPAAAESWEVSSDGLRCTFHLRSAVWSNGEPVTAEDFAASYRRVLSPATAAPKAELFYLVKNARAYVAGRLTDFSQVGIRASDPRTLVITLEEPNPHFLAYAASGPWIPVNPRIVKREKGDWTRPGRFVGNGPYVLTEWLPGQRIAVRKNPLFRDAARIRLGGIQFVRFDDGGGEERAYRAGEIDLTMAVPFDRLAAYARDRPAELHRQPLAETRYLTFNTRRPPLADPRVRRALSLAIDRSRIVRDVLHGGEQTAHRLIPPPIELSSSRSDAGSGVLSRVVASPPGVPSSAPGAENFPADAAKARRLLREAGFPLGRNFPGLELSGWTGAAGPVLEAIQAMWKKELGIEVALVTREARVHVSALRSGNYDIGYVTLIPDVADPLSVLEYFTSDSANNYPHWADPGYDRLIGAATTSADPPARTLKLETAESRLLAAAPLAPLYFNAQNWLMQPYVRGWEQDALWNRYYPSLWMERTRAGKE